MAHSKCSLQEFPCYQGLDYYYQALSLWIHLLQGFEISNSVANDKKDSSPWDPATDVVTLCTLSLSKTSLAHSAIIIDQQVINQLERAFMVYLLTDVQLFVKFDRLYRGDSLRSARCTKFSSKNKVEELSLTSIGGLWLKFHQTCIPKCFLCCCPSLHFETLI